MHYVVMNIVGGRVIYSDTNLASAADHLVEGRTFGKGETESDALQQAFGRAQCHRADGYAGPGGVSQKRTKTMWQKAG